MPSLDHYSHRTLFYARASTAEPSNAKGGGGMSVLTGDLGSPVRETRSVSGFRRIALDGIGRVRVEHSDVEAVDVEAPEQLIEHIKIFVDGETLHLGFRQGLNLHHVGKLDIRFAVRAKEVEGLAINGAGSIDADRLEGKDANVEIDGTGRIGAGSIEAQTVEFSVDGAGKIEIEQAAVQTCHIDLDGAGRIGVRDLRTRQLALAVDGAGKLSVERLDCQEFDARLDGTGKITAAGKAADLRVDVNGAGKLQLDDLETERASIEIDGTGKVDLSVTKTLDVRIDGFGRVGYRGRPELNVRSGGFGKVIRLDESEGSSGN